MFFLFHKENNIEQKQVVFLQQWKDWKLLACWVFLLGLHVIPYQQGEGLQDVQLRDVHGFCLRCSAVGFLFCVV